MDTTFISTFVVKHDLHIIFPARSENSCLIFSYSFTSYEPRCKYLICVSYIAKKKHLCALLLAV